MVRNGKQKSVQKPSKMVKKKEKKKRKRSKKVLVKNGHYGQKRSKMVKWVQTV